MFWRMLSGHTCISAAPSGCRSAFRGRDSALADADRGPRSGARRRARTWRVALTLALMAALLVVISVTPASAGGPVGPTIQWRMGSAPDQASQVWVRGWTPLASLTLQVRDPGANVVYTQPFNTDSGGNAAWSTGSFTPGPLFTVSVSDPLNPGVPSLIIDPALQVYAANADENTVSGHANLGQSVYVEFYEEGGGGSSTSADGSTGDWTIDFDLTTPTYDITPGMNGDAAITDGAGHILQVPWHAYVNGIQADPDTDWFGASEWSPDTTVTFTFSNDVNPANPGESTQDVKTDGGGNAWLQAGYDFAPGQFLHAQAGLVLRTLYVDTAFFVTGADPVADTVSGEAPAGRGVTVYAYGDPQRSVAATASAGGTWTADFSAIGGLAAGNGGNVHMRNASGDNIMREWSIPSRRISVGVDGDWANANDWPKGVFVTFTFDDGITVPAPTRTELTDGNGNAWVGVWPDIDIAPGMTVYATDGVVTKILFVPFGFTVTGADADLDTVSGTAPEGTRVDVNLNTGMPGPSPSAQATAVAGDTWTATFTVDIGPGSNGGASVTNPNGDSVVRDWNIKDPRIKVGLDSDYMDAWDFNGPGTVTFVFSDGLGEVYRQSMPIDVNGNGQGSTWDVAAPGEPGFDIVGGLTVEAGDGTTTKTIDLPMGFEVTDVDDVGNTVSGTAPADTKV
ncbi:MAG TPA: hypothetical protein VF902_09935, partial [Coriobacteriia bacterium]